MHMDNKSITAYSGLVIVVLATLAIANPVQALQQQQGGYSANSIYYPPQNTTNPIPPMMNNTMPQPPEQNSTLPQPPEENNTTPVPQPPENATDGSIFITANGIHSSDIGNGVQGVFVLPPAQGFALDGDIIWQATGNVTLTTNLPDNVTSTSEPADSGALHFSGSSLQFQNEFQNKLQPFDVTYSLQAHLVPATTAP